MKWSSQQIEALNAVAQWIRKRDKQVFRLFGYAGTGKTTLARHIAESIDGDVLFAAFTGKAASVLKAKGCEDASTIHSLIYRAREDDDGGPLFKLNPQSPAAKAKLIIIDECSMVDEELGLDLLSFRTPILVLGDPAQLPPIKDSGFFTGDEPDIMLDQVHRQAQDNPIIHLSMLIREGGRLPKGTFGESKVISRREISSEDVMKADQVLVGMNKTRRLYNERIRELKGFHDSYPVAGEKLICLRNDKTKGLLNGSSWIIDKLRSPKGEQLRMDIHAEDDIHKRSIQISVLKAFFEGKEDELSYSQKKDTDELTYGYALTVHKAQGSQWDHIVLFDESYAFREHQKRWLYTALTRAAEQVIVVQ